MSVQGRRRKTSQENTSLNLPTDASDGERNLMNKQVRSTCGFSLILALCAGLTNSAYADGSVSSLGMGGGAPTEAAFRQYEAVVSQYNKSGERFRIDTSCRSACTMFLGIRNVCIEPGATLQFHAGGSMQRGLIMPAYTQRMMQRYNAPLKRYLTANHYMDTFEFHSVSGSDMIQRFKYRACP